MLVTFPLHDINFAVSQPIDIKSLQNRLLNVCYVPAPGPLRLHFFLPLTVLMKQTRQVVCVTKQSILLRFLLASPMNDITFCLYRN